MLNIQEITNNLEMRKALILDGFKSKKKQCCANIIFNEKGQILLLKRSSQDSFHPSTYCLAGGGIDDGENPIDGVKRETFEETSMQPEDLKIYKVDKISLKDVDIYYFHSILLSDVFITLDESEHENYIWCTPEEWNELDLILDLKEHLKKLLNIKLL